MSIIFLFARLALIIRIFRSLWIANVPVQMGFHIMKYRLVIFLLNRNLFCFYCFDSQIFMTIFAKKEIGRSVSAYMLFVKNKVL